MQASQIEQRLLVCILLLSTSLCATVLTRPSNMLAAVFTIYPQSTASLPNGQLPYIFTKAFNVTPVFVYGINDYKLGDKFGTEHFLSNCTSLSGSGFTISYVSISTTNVKKLSVSFLAVAHEENFFTVTKNYANSQNISTTALGNVQRTFTSYENYNFTSVAVGQPFLTGFYIKSTTSYQLKITINYLSSVNYIVTIGTLSDCTINQTNFIILFYYPSQLIAKNYYIYGNSSVFSSSSINGTEMINYNVFIPNYNETIFVMALRGMYGLTPVDGLTFGWSVISITNDTGVLLVNRTNIKEVFYSFLQIGVKTTISDIIIEPEGSTGYLGIVVGLVVGIVLIGIGILVYVKFCCKKTVYSTPQKDDFRELPSLSF